MTKRILPRQNSVQVADNYLFSSDALSMFRFDMTFEMYLKFGPLAKDQWVRPASRKWSSGWTGLLQTIIRMDQPLANDHPDGPASCKWLSGWTSLLQMVIRIKQIFLHFSFYSSANLLFSIGVQTKLVPPNRWKRQGFLRIAWSFIYQLLIFQGWDTI